MTMDLFDMGFLHVDSKTSVRTAANVTELKRTFEELSAASRVRDIGAGVIPRDGLWITYTKVKNNTASNFDILFWAVPNITGTGYRVGYEREYGKAKPTLSKSDIELHLLTGRGNFNLKFEVDPTKGEAKNFSISSGIFQDRPRITKFSAARIPGVVAKHINTHLHQQIRVQEQSHECLSMAEYFALSLAAEVGHSPQEGFGVAQQELKEKALQLYDQHMSIWKFSDTLGDILREDPEQFAQNIEALLPSASNKLDLINSNLQRNFHQQESHEVYRLLYGISSKLHRELSNGVEPWDTISSTDIGDKTVFLTDVVTVERMMQFESVMVLGIFDKSKRDLTLYCLDDKMGPKTISYEAHTHRDAVEIFGQENRKIVFGGITIPTMINGEIIGVATRDTEAASKPILSDRLTPSQEVREQLATLESIISLLNQARTEQTPERERKLPPTLPLARIL